MLLALGVIVGCLQGGDSATLIDPHQCDLSLLRAYLRHVDRGDSALPLPVMVDALDLRNRAKSEVD